MSFRLTELVPMLETDNMATTIHFYSTILNFSVVDTFEDEDGNPVWASLMHGELEIMFKTPNMLMNYGQILLTGNLYMHTNDANAVWQKVKDQA